MDSYNGNPIFNIRTQHLYDSFFADTCKEFDFDSSYISEPNLVRDLNQLNIPFLSVYGINARSLKKNFSEVKNFISALTLGKSFPHIVGISETWSKNNLHGLNIKNYNSFSNDRPTGKYGGVAAYIHNSIVAEQISDRTHFITNIIETLTLKIKVKGTKYVVGILYRPNTHLLLLLVAHFLLIHGHHHFLAGPGTWQILAVLSKGL